MSSLREPGIISEIKTQGENQVIIDNICNDYIKRLNSTNKLNNFKKTHTYKKITHLDSSEHCSICIDKLEPGKYKRELLCNHTFHKICIDNWLKEHETCPTCRRVVFD